MEHSTWLRETLVFLAAAVILLPLVQRLKSTSILGFFTVGLVIGPYGLALISDSEDIHHLGELGVVFLLFTIGLELSLSRLRLLARYVFGLGGLQICITAFLIDVLLVWFKVPLQSALILGGALALSSTAFVTELLLERNELMSRHGRVSFAVLLSQDIAVIPMLVFQDLLGNSVGSITQAFLTAAASGLLAVFGIIVAGRFVLRPVYRTIARTNNPDLFVAATLLLILGSGWMLVQFGLSMTMGAFLCGVLLAESEYRHQIEADIRPFKGLLLGLFFATVGMSLDLGFIVAHMLEVALFVILLIALKSSVLSLLSALFGLNLRESVRAGLLLGQGGEFAFVILGSALKSGLIRTETAQLAMAVVGLSMVLTPVLD
ncbi:MAG: cation:proton antiporter domain-containing protein, partial [Gammaproteobacteria bacterium]